MNTCRTCQHWNQGVADRANGSLAGQCRAQPPSTSYNWPRTRSDDYCSAHSANTQFATGAGTASRTEHHPTRELDNQAALPLEAPVTRSKAGPRLRQRL